MKTLELTKSVENLLDNGFVVKGVKWIGKFNHNEIFRPLTLHEALQFISKYTDLSVYDLTLLNFGSLKFAEDFHTNWKSDSKIVITNSGIELVFGKGNNKKTVRFTRENYIKFINDYRDLFYEEVFTTEFEFRILQNEKYKGYWK